LQSPQNQPRKYPKKLKNEIEVINSSQQWIGIPDKTNESSKWFRDMIPIVVLSDKTKEFGLLSSFRVETTQTSFGQLRKAFRFDKVPANAKK
jgi:hypothetical protein